MNFRKNLAMILAGTTLVSAVFFGMPSAGVLARDINIPGGYCEGTYGETYVPGAYVPVINTELLKFFDLEHFDYDYENIDIYEFGDAIYNLDIGPIVISIEDLDINLKALGIRVTTIEELYALEPTPIPEPEYITELAEDGVTEITIEVTPKIEGPIITQADIDSIHHAIDVARIKAIEEAIRQKIEDAIKDLVRKVTWDELQDYLADTSGFVNIYRICDRNTEEHLYTSDPIEVVELSALGWRFEGMGWQAPVKGDPVYRLYRSGGFHMYSAREDEIEELTLFGGWTLDNDGMPLFYSGGDYDIPRLYNSHKKQHILTSDGNEARTLMYNGWTHEDSGILAETLPNQDPPVKVEILEKGDYSVKNVDAFYAIEADVTLTGVGTGYHAKLVVCTPTSAVSFGIQFDQYAQAPYQNRPYFILENIYSNDEGGQQYTRYGMAKNKETYHLMVAVEKDGTATCYIDGDLVAKVKNPELANERIMYLRCEGSGRKNGDYVDAEFANISLLAKGRYNPSKEWDIYEFESNPGIEADFPSLKGGYIKGMIMGFWDHEDWDSEYEVSSGIVQFVE